MATEPTDATMDEITYKVVNSEQLDDSLKTIADAIRSKGGTSAPLAFPDGMAQAIASIPSGGDTPVLIPASIEENGTYEPPEGVDGFSRIIANVPQGGGGELSLDLPSDTGDYNLGACYMLIDKSSQIEILSMKVEAGNSAHHKVEIGNIVNDIFVVETEYTDASTIEIPAHNSPKVVKVTLTYNNYSAFCVYFNATTSADVISYRLNLPNGVDNNIGYYPCYTPSTRRWQANGQARVIQSYAMFNYCNAEEIDISFKNPVVQPNTTFQYALGTKRIKITGVLNGNTNQMFYNCRNLRTIDFSGISLGTNVKQIKQMFQYCEKITELDLSFMATQSALFTNIDGFNRMMASLKTINLDGWNVSHLTAVYDVFDGCSSLENISMVGTSWIASNFYLSSCTKLTVESLNAVIAALPNVSGKTLTLGTVNKNKLTAAEKQVATDKGWTIA